LPPTFILVLGFLHATQHVEFLMRIFGKYFFIRLLENILKHTLVQR